MKTTIIQTANIQNPKGLSLKGRYNIYNENCKVKVVGCGYGKSMFFFKKK
jgi:hypothetical protein